MINDSFVLVKNFHNFPYVFLHITLITHCGPTQPLQIKIWTNLNLHYPRMPPYKWYDMNNKSFGVLKKKNFKECSMNYFLKKFISHYGSIFAQGVMIRANLNLNYKRTLTNHGFAVLKRFLKMFLCISYVKLRFPIVAPLYCGGSWFELHQIYTTRGYYHLTMTNHSFPVLAKKIFPIYVYVKFW